MTAPAFLITIDTEGDNIWSRPSEVTTRNASYIPRFQTLCEKFTLKPTYLVNYEMAVSPTFIEFGRDVLKRGTAEIGMHLHAWNSPPLIPLGKPGRPNPYLVEYPDEVIYQKVGYMTDILRNTFDSEIVSHRSGRWVLNEIYARALVAHGYKVDCSVTPNVEWKEFDPVTGARLGVDYRDFPDRPYFIDPNDISRCGNSSLLELPVTIIDPAPILRRIEANAPSFATRAARTARKAWPVMWMRPNARNRGKLPGILSIARREKRSYVELILHSSELMPGGSPYFPDHASIESLYKDLEALFAAAQDHFKGKTLSEFRNHFEREFSVGR
jgi:hypothetical protein